MTWTRRRVLASTALLFAPLPVVSRERTPACGPQTQRQTAGPFFAPNSPRKPSLREEDAQAPAFLLTGVVLSTGCKPVANALVDFWHADDFGEYDNRGYRYRGHQYTDAQGRYRLETIVPGEYPGRTRHFHVNVQAPGGRVLTTQLYFPNDPGNRRDGLHRPELEMKMKDRSAGSFDFVVAA